MNFEMKYPYFYNLLLFVFTEYRPMLNYCLILLNYILSMFNFNFLLHFVITEYRPMFNYFEHLLNDFRST
jgi:hypothetical protein